MLKKHGRQERHEVLSQGFLGRMHAISFSPVICDKIKGGKDVGYSSLEATWTKEFS
jgi:hypothetical protein